MVKPILKMEHLYKSFKSHLSIKKYRVVRDLSLEVYEGEIFGFIGPNGAGKTTTIKMVMGLIFPDHGSIEIFGNEISDLAAKERIGFLPENPSFYGYLTGKEFLHFYGQLYGLSSSEREEKAHNLLTLVGLTDHGAMPLRKYSRGMLQRMGLAQALLNDPDLIILDEPMSSLDPIGRREFRDIILDLKRKGKTVFFSSHILQDAEMICDRVGIIKNGELKLQGKLSELISPKVKFWDLIFSKVEPASIHAKADILSSESGQYLSRIFTETELNQFIKDIEDKGGEVVSITPHKESLEDLFVSKVKDSR